MKNRQKEIVNHLTDKELMINFYFSQGLIFFIALVLSFFLFDEMIDVFKLFDFQDLRVITIGGSAGIIVVCIDLFLMKYLPPHLYDDGGINERLFSNRGIGQIFLMTLIVAFCEELLFRGVMQTSFGLFSASLIFAVVHYRYLFNKFLFVNIVLLSFFIGLIYDWTENISVTFFMHFIIDFLSGCHIYFQQRHKE